MDGISLLVFFEAARADSLREFGLPYSEIQARGLSALTVQARLKNHTCARVDDVLAVQVKLADAGRLRFKFAYEVRRPLDNALIATGETTHICVESTSSQPARLPDWFVAALDRLPPSHPAGG